MIFYLFFGVFFFIKSSLIFDIVLKSIKNKKIENRIEEDHPLPRLDYAKPGWPSEQIPLALCHTLNIIQSDLDLEKIARKKGFLNCKD